MATQNLRGGQTTGFELGTDFEIVSARATPFGGPITVRCILCGPGQKPTPLTNARQHRKSAKHQALVRDGERRRAYSNLSESESSGASGRGSDHFPAGVIPWPAPPNLHSAALIPPAPSRLRVAQQEEERAECDDVPFDPPDDGFPDIPAPIKVLPYAKYMQHIAMQEADAQFEREHDFWPDNEGGEEFREAEEAEVDDVELEGFLKTLAVEQNPSGWAPFPSKEIFLSLLISSIPRHPVSDAFLKVLLAWATAMGAPNIPSFTAIKAAGRQIDILTGVGDESQTRREGSLGNVYYTNSLEDYIKKWANPLVRPHLSLYPRRDHGLHGFLDGSFLNAQVDVRLSPPMIVLPGTSSPPRHAFNLEPLLLRDRTLVWTRRWFQRQGKLCGEGAVLVLKVRGTGWEPDGEKTREFSIDEIELVGDEVLFALEGKHVVYETCAAVSKEMPLLNPLRSVVGNAPVYACYYKGFIDDMSGGKTKKFNPHNSAYVSCVSLPPRLENLEGNIFFLATSALAHPLELAEGMNTMFQECAQRLVKVWDVTTHATAYVIPSMPVETGDNPMLCACSSTMGAGANKNCRACNVGGTQKEKASAEGFTAILKPGTPRTPAETRAEIDNQLELAAAGHSTKLSTSRSKTGVRDQLADEHCQVLLRLRTEIRTRKEEQLNRPLRKAEKAEIDLLIRQAKDKITAGVYMSSFVTKTAFDIHLQSPPEILHSFLLGALKYLLSITMADSSPAFKEALRLSLSSVSTAGLEVGATLNADYLIRHHGSLVGREMKVFAQVGAIALRPLVEAELLPEDVWDVWRVMGTLAMLLWRNGLEPGEEEKYFSDLDQALRSAYHAMARLRPINIVKGAKWHNLSHAAPAWRLFGPLHGCATEGFEKFNGVFRYASIGSNRLAPSRDVGRTLHRQAALRHIISGGFVQNGSEHQEPGKALQNLVTKNALFRRLYGMEGASRPPPGKFSFSNKNPAVLPSAVLLADIGVPHDITPDAFRCAVSVISQAGDTCRVGDFVHFDAGCIHEEFSPCVYRIEHLVTPHRLDLPPPHDKPFVILRNYQRQHDLHVSLRFPVYERTESVTTQPPSGVTHLLNMNHDCLTAGCAVALAGGRAVHEREKPDIAVAVMDHHQPDILFTLNPHLFRSSSALQHLYPPLPLPPTIDEIGVIAARVLSGEAPDDDDTGDAEMDGGEQHSQGAADMEIDGEVGEEAAGKKAGVKGKAKKKAKPRAGKGGAKVSDFVRRSVDTAARRLLGEAEAEEVEDIRPRHRYSYKRLAGSGLDGSSGDENDDEDDNDDENEDDDEDQGDDVALA